MANLRWLAVHPGPEFSVADVHRGWVKGLRNLGQTVVDLNLNDRLTFYENAHVPDNGGWKQALSDAHQVARLAAAGIEQQAYRVWPDVVLISSGFYVPPETYEVLRARGHRVVLLCTESPYEDDRQIPQAAYADVVLVNDPANLRLFRDVNPNSHYVPHSYDPDIHRPQPADPDLACDFAFVGTGYQSRRTFFETVCWDGLDATFAGNWGLPGDSPIAHFALNKPHVCIDNDEAARLYGSCKTSANLYRREAASPDLTHGWAMGPREVELAACGTFFLRDPRPEGDELLPMLPTFTSPQEFEDELRWWLNHDDLRAKAAEEARQAVAGRTFDSHARWLLKQLDKEH